MKKNYFKSLPLLNRFHMNKNNTSKQLLKFVTPSNHKNIQHCIQAVVEKKIQMQRTQYGYHKKDCINLTDSSLKENWCCYAANCC